MRYIREWSERVKDFVKIKQQYVKNGQTSLVENSFDTQQNTYNLYIGAWSDRVKDFL